MAVVLEAHAGPFFGLQCEPFSVAPDPRVLFLSRQHREALAHLQHGLRGAHLASLMVGDEDRVWR